MRPTHLPFVIFLVILCSCSPSLEDIKDLAAAETFPADEFLHRTPAKKAMVVVAHDDDMSAMAGTLAGLKENGWEIRQLAFVSGQKDRDLAAAEAAQVITSSSHFINIQPEQRRKDLDSSTVPYHPIPREYFPSAFNTDRIADSLFKEIRRFQPSVIFSLDNEIGGYGHPEHILVSQLLIDSLKQGHLKAERIYQSVYPNSMEKKILRERLSDLMKKWGFPSSYLMVTEMYGLEGMPEPTVEINITAQAGKKMAYLRSFLERERKTIAFFVPMFEDFEAEDYFQVFDREFFRVIHPSK